MNSSSEIQPTPRVDALVDGKPMLADGRVWDWSIHRPLIDLARQLERELAEARATK